MRAYGKAHNTTILLHSDAGQAPLYRSPQVHSLGVDMFSLGSGKLYGPRGIGCLYISNRASLHSTVFGGGQERGLRSGTEDVALAVGFASALDAVTFEREAESKRLRLLRDTFAASLRQGFGGQARDLGIVINGDLKHSLPHMLNISVPGERTGEYIVLALDHAGVALSTKSACREGEALSHVVLALGDGKSAASSVVLTKEERARNTLRFSLGRDTTEKELKRTLAILEDILPK